MADKSTKIILDALSRAAASPDGAPLLAARGGAGLFPSTPAGKQAAQRCQDEGWLRTAITAIDAPTTNGDTAVLVRKKTQVAPDNFILTEKGLSWLVGQTSPRQVLEDFVRALEARQTQAADLLASLRRMQAGFDALKCGAEKVLDQLSRPVAPSDPSESMMAHFRRFHNGSAETRRNSEPPADLQTLLLARLTEWQPSAAGEDCALPELYRRAQTTVAGLSIGAFHDALRRLHDAGQVYLHPWTGPLHALPEPPYALLVGHEIAYYASLKN